MTTSVWEQFRQHWQYAPPWRDIKPCGELGDEYGPATEGRWIADMVNHGLSIAGGGLWDQSAVPPRTKRHRLRNYRREVMDYVNRGGFMTIGWMEIYDPYFVCRKSSEETAELLGITALTVRKRARRLQMAATRKR